MKYCVSLLTLFLSLQLYGQNRKLSFTFCPLAAADFFSFPTLQGGVEYKMTPKFSWYNEFGIEYVRSFIGLPDSVILQPHGIKVKTEFRYYFQPRHYLAINSFFTSDVHNTEVYYHKKDTLMSRVNVFGVRKKVWGFNVVYGKQQMIGKRFGLDLYAGVGVRLRYITTVGEQFKEDLDYLEQPIDYSVTAAKAATEAKGGFSVAPNLSGGIRLCYWL